MAWLAWHIAALSRIKKLPKLERMLVSTRGPRPRQTWQEQMAIMGMWAAVMARIGAQERKQGEG